MTAQATATEVHLPEEIEAETLSNDLKRLLVRSEKALDREGVRDGIAKLESWVESYRHGLSAAHKMSDRGSALLHKVRDQLCLSLEELTRLEGEGGNPASKEQSEQIEELNRAIRHIDRLLPSVEQAFQHMLPESEEA